jgi:putative membrane protein insertion efficiency factor
MVSCRARRVTPRVIALLLMVAASAHSDDWSNLRLVVDSREDQQPQAQAGKSKLDLSNSTNEFAMAGLVLLRLYQLVLSSQDGPRCMFYPSCSEYAKQALVERGAVVGTFLAIDRYLRCNGADRHLYPYDPNLRKLLDPVPESRAKPSSE